MLMILAQTANPPTEYSSTPGSHLRNATLNTGRLLPELTTHPIVRVPSPKTESSHDVDTLSRPTVLTEQVVGK